MSRMRFITAALAAIAIAGCSAEKAGAPPSGKMQIRVDALTTTYSITRIALDVQPANIQQDLVYDGYANAFTGSLLVPVGVQTITARAWANDTEVGVGSATVDVVGGATASVFITIYDTTGRDPLPDHSPIVTSLVVPSTKLVANEPVTLSATAVDPDGDPLTYTWSQSCTVGTFSPPDAPVTTWTATEAATCTLTLLVESNGLHDSASVTVMVVDDKTGAVDVSGRYVPNPTMQSVSVSTYDRYTTVYRWDSNVMTGTIPLGTAATVSLSYDLGTSYPGTYAPHLRDDCGGTAVLNYSYLGYASYSWTPPANAAACVLSASVEHEGLSDAMPVVIAVAPCSDKLQCGYSETCGADGVCTYPRWVEGTKQTTYWQNGWTATYPSPGVESTTVEALVPDRKGGFSVHSGWMYSDGWFYVPDVPTGRYLLSLKRGTNGARTLVDTTSDWVDLGQDELGRPNKAFPTMSTPVTTELNGLEPWVAGDQLQVTALNAGVWDAVSERWSIPDGSVWFSQTEDWWPNLVDANQGDELWVHQLAQREAPGAPGTTYLTATRAIRVDGVVMSDGVASWLGGNVSEVAQTGVADVDWRTSAFEQFAAELGPAGNAQPEGHMLYVDATPAGTGYGAPVATWGTPDLLLMRAQPGTPDLSAGPLAYGQFFPGWNEFRGAMFTTVTNLTAPGTSIPYELPGNVTTFDPLPGAPREVTPRTGPVLAPTLAGLDLTGAAVSGVGTAPVLSWTEPSTGPADRYVVRVFEVRPCTAPYDAETCVLTRGMVYTRNTSVPLPLDFVPGRWYVARITAYRDPLFTVEAPLRSSYTNASASRVTAMWTP